MVEYKVAQVAGDAFDKLVDKGRAGAATLRMDIAAHWAVAGRA